MYGLSDWKTFVSEHCFFLFHVPSSSIVQVPERIAQSLQSEIPNSHLEELQVLGNSLITSKAYEHITPSPITHIALNVAERCNLRCTYCYAGDGDYGSNSLMSFETARKAILFFAREQSVLHISFFGGEPLLNFALVKEVAEWCATLNFSFRFSLTTNGVLLNESHLEFFKTHKFELKISYDGKELQNTQRTHNVKLA